MSLKIQKDDAKNAANPLETSDPLKGLGKDEANALVVVVPDKKDQDLPQTKFWIVDGPVENALTTRGVRCRLYQIADIGHYDPNIQSVDSKKKAFWYDQDGKLLIHVIFKHEPDALRFRSQLFRESITIGSPLNGLTVQAEEVHHCSLDNETLIQIASMDYYPDDKPDSLQESESQISSSVVSFADKKSELFQFQRIEDESFFLEGFKIAHSAHVMPKKFYRTNPSNRLALSPDLHSCFDAKVEVEVTLLKPTFKGDCESFEKGSKRTKDGTFRTHVYFEDENVFKECLDWRSAQIDAKWGDFNDMTPAVD